MSTPTPAPKTSITLTGSLRRDPVERFTRERVSTERVPDQRVEGGFVAQRVTIPARPYWKLSLEVYRGGKSETHDCVVWNPVNRPEVESADRAREGDRVILTGYYERYSFTRNGQEISGRHFVVESFESIG